MIFQNFTIINHLGCTIEMNVTSRASNKTLDPYLITIKWDVCVCGKQKYMTYTVYVSKSLHMIVYMGKCIVVFVSVYVCIVFLKKKSSMIYQKNLHQLVIR
jgi:hypothetical protein